MSSTNPNMINFITGNKNKLAETRAILGDVVQLSNQNIEILEIQGSLEEIARDKCQKAALAVNGPVLTEDSALEFRALKGLPGPYIKCFYSALGNDGLHKLLAAYDDKVATAVCTFAFSAGPGSEPLLFQGRTQGKIVPKRGEGGFGFDPIFEVDGQTYAEMSITHKNMVSERSKALEKLQNWLRNTV
ncbi:uncharacterized protein N7479_004096 [Penicillium vulpinum]|uniref:Inosine triphosphate pyrophosphatase n=1 Tax=Penicillium vulpinum TaxID=29845 RepID=A0A1V6SDC4_9EURO|nr:uncharacterized protein N7479_004096 [Penicillium vulpinum]KAJ5964220.1 hypothetical protein N7479_004096 [Penicillium vulpinum]OQE11780.1 hypothetical protein PENVUL_c002G10204 [Penicillium vulpinum]